MNTATDSPLGANAERSRSHNKQMVLSQIRSAGRIGRAEIARATGLSIQAVSNITSDLLDDGMLLNLGRKSEGRGQPPVMFALNPEGGFALGVEVRPDAIHGAILDLAGTCVAQTDAPLPATDRRTISATLLKVRNGLLTRSGIPTDRLLGAGVVMPGPFGSTGIRDSASNLPGWDDISPDEWFADTLKIPVIVENDANAAAMAERISGAAQDVENLAYLYFGRGLGLGIISQGRLVKGALGNAGEIGHITVIQNDAPVRLEDAVSRLSAEAALAKAGIEIGKSGDMARLYEAREKALMGWLESALEPLSQAVGILENLFDPDTVILGGAMPDGILDYFATHAPLPELSVANRPERSHDRLIAGGSGHISATLGAAALVINHAFTPRLAARAAS